MQGPNVAAYTTDWWIYIPIHRNAERVAWITANAKRIIAAYYITKSTAIRFWSEELPSNCCVQFIVSSKLHVYTTSARSKLNSHCCHYNRSGNWEDEFTYSRVSGYQSYHRKTNCIAQLCLTASSQRSCNYYKTNPCMLSKIQSLTNTFRVKHFICCYLLILIILTAKVLEFQENGAQQAAKGDCGTRTDLSWGSSIRTPGTSLPQT